MAASEVRAGEGPTGRLTRLMSEFWEEYKRAFPVGKYHDEILMRVVEIQQYVMREVPVTSVEGGGAQC